MGTKPAKVGHLALGPFNVLKWVPGGSDSQKDLHFTKSGRRGLEGPPPGDRAVPVAIRLLCRRRKAKSK